MPAIANYEVEITVKVRVAGTAEDPSAAGLKALGRVVNMDRNDNLSNPEIVALTVRRT